MDDLYELYQLPPPPPRIIFSSSSPSRARLPNFNSATYQLPDGLTASSPAEASRVFVRHLFYVGEKWPRSTFIQFKLVAGIMILLFFLFNWVLIRRIRSRTFWVFRKIKKPNGTLVAPNATIGFSFFEGVFCLALIAFLWEFARFENGKMPQAFAIWALVTWSPLIVGAWFGFIGTAFARPSSKASPYSKKSLFTLKPMTINLICIVVPVVQVSTIVIPAVISNRAYGKVQTRWKAWDEKYLMETELSREMLLEATFIWGDLLKALETVAWAFVVWSIWAFLLTGAYGGVGFSLLRTIRKQIRKLQELGVERTSEPSQLSPRTPSIPLTPISPSCTLLGSPTVKTPLDLKADFEMKLKRSASLNSFHFPGGGNRDPANLTSPPWLDSDPYPSGGAPEKTSAEEADLIFSQRELIEDLPHPSFFPSLRPSTFKSFRVGPSPRRPAPWKIFRSKEEAGIKKKNGELQARFLETVYYNFIVNFGGKLVGEATFSGVALYLALNLYAAAETNEMGICVEVASLWAAWGSVFFGSITLAAITQRSYEPATQAYLLLSERKRAPSDDMGLKSSPTFPRLVKKASRSLSASRSRFRLGSNPNLVSQEDQAVIDLGSPAGSLAERRKSRDTFGLGIREAPFVSSGSFSRSNFVIQQTVEQIVDELASPKEKVQHQVSRKPVLALQSPALSVASTLYGEENGDQIKRQDSLQSLRKFSETSPRTTPDSPTAFPSSPFFNSPQSPYFSSPNPNRINSNRFLGKSESSLNMDQDLQHQNSNFTFPSTTSPITSPRVAQQSPTISRKTSAHSLASSVLGSLRNKRPQSPTNGLESGSSQEHSQPRLPWVAPSVWESGSPDEELIAEIISRKPPRT